MYDGLSSGIWAIISEEEVASTRQYEISHDDLQLPYELSARFDRWIVKGMDDPENPNNPQGCKFITEGRQLAIDLKRFLGSAYTVVYASQGDVRVDEEITLKLTDDS